MQRLNVNQRTVLRKTQPQKNKLKQTTISTDAQNYKNLQYLARRAHLPVAEYTRFLINRELVKLPEAQREENDLYVVETKGVVYKK